MPNQNRLFNLLRNNIRAERDYRVIRNEADDEATIYLYDAIDQWGGVSADQIVKDLHGLTAPTIHLRINSPGGDVFQARPIATAIAEHASHIITHIDGLAASAATYVAIQAKEVRMAQGAFFMIHRAWTWSWGNSAELRKTAGLLDKLDESIVRDYVRKTGIEAQGIEQWMDEETWFTADEAQTHGFVDIVVEPGSTPKNRWDLSAYARAPQALTCTESDEPNLDQALLNHREHAERRVRLWSLAL